MHFQSTSAVQNKVKISLKSTAILSLLIMVTACQPKGETPSDKQSETATSSQAPKNLSPYIEAKTRALTPKQPQSCDETGCTRYDFQTVETNHAWINQYFLDRIQNMDPLAFEREKKPIETNNRLFKKLYNKICNIFFLIIKPLLHPTKMNHN